MMSVILDLLRAKARGGPCAALMVAAVVMAPARPALADPEPVLTPRVGDDGGATGDGSGTMGVAGFNPAAGARADDGDDDQLRDETHLEQVQMVREVAAKLYGVCSQKKGQDLLEDRARLDDMAPGDLGEMGLPLGTFHDDFRAPICERFCDTGGNGGGPRLDLCALRAEPPVLAHAAVAADWDSLAWLLQYLHDALASAVQPADPAGTTDDKLDKSLIVGLGKALAKSTESLHGAPAIAALLASGGVPELASRSLEALAKVIADRAKREAIGWVLASLERDLCSRSDDIKDYWLPALCALAQKERLAGYGAGSALLEVLRSAILEDLKRLPAAVIGMLAAEGFWRTAYQPPAGAGPPLAQATFAACGSKEFNDAADQAGVNVCPQTRAVRDATLEAMRGFLAGGSGAHVLYEWSEASGRANRSVLPGGNEAYWLSPPLQLAACAAALPHSFQRNRPRFALRQRAAASFITALVTTSACWPLVGKGYDEIDALTAETMPAQKLALDQPDIERLTTVFRLYRGTWGAAHALDLHFDAFLASVDRFHALLKGMAKDPGALIPKIDFAAFAQAEDPVRAAQAYLQVMRSNETLAWQARAQAALDVVEQAIALSRAGLDALDGAARLAQLPGLCGRDQVRRSCELFKGIGLGSAQAARLREAHALLRDMAATVSMLRQLVAAEWGAATTSALAVLQQRWLGTKSTIDRLYRYSGMLLAIASAEDADAMGRALEAAFNPPGGWRRKSQPDYFELSVTSHAGLLGALEWRRGRYLDVNDDDVVDDNDDLDWDRANQAPTLALPVGLDFAWGRDGVISPFGLFVSLLDPAAFLQYDASNDGRLPGPRPITALAPGLGIRLGIRDTPLSIMPFFMYRPRLRTPAATIDGPGADALQLGLMLTVDVTLFRLHSSAE
ncbi:hypothetical protein [Haliangium sp.]|uniref:hypothetical protein n=1 Tax=Haliangium sp. TaxID=2663208 RepID=UPI003D0D6450